MRPSNKKYIALEKLLQGLKIKEVARAVNASYSRIQQVKREFPLFFWKQTKARREGFKGRT